MFVELLCHSNIKAKINKESFPRHDNIYVPVTSKFYLSACSLDKFVRKDYAGPERIILTTA
jgi:hypothetical protein